MRFDGISVVICTLLVPLVADRSLQAQGPSRDAQTSGPIWLDSLQQELQEPAPETFIRDILKTPDGADVHSLESWQMRRHEIRKWWLEFLGVPAVNASLAISTLNILKRETVDGVTRCLVQYETQPSWSTQAYLLFPASGDILRDSSVRLPAVAVFHSTTNETIRQPAGLGSDPTKAFGWQLAKRGYVALCPECFLWHEGPPYDYQRQVRRFQESSPGSRGMAKMLLDAQATVNLLAALPGVDSNRIGAIGHSLGGKEVLYLAAFDERIRAAVSSEGGVGLGFSNWDAPWYLGPEVRDPNFGHDHHELLALIAPRPFLLIGGDSADGEKSLPYLRAAWAVYKLYTDRPALGLWNHRKGHTVPAEAETQIAEWFDAFLKAP